MGVTLGCVEEEVAYTGAGYVLLLWRYIGEEDSVSDFWAGPGVRNLLQVGLAEVGEAEEPEDGFGEAGEDAQPGAEGGGFDLFFSLLVRVLHPSDEEWG